ncbi:MAG: 3-isopropylmalate dehydratase small subunit [Rhodospirillales bacterium]|nr:3-isopropylmalate dehydratase small subunit [Rhodospirillales bacterium]
MNPFTVLSAIAAPLPLANIDTDMIIPKQFLKTVKRTGLGVSAFYELRYDEDGTENPDFILNKEPYRGAEILIAGDNFGCGSSREHAPWALLDFGIRCIISTSFADIFYNNSFKNGILPIKLPAEQVDILMKDAENGHEMTIDLEKQLIRAANCEYRFDIDPFRKKCLLNGLDDIGLTLEKESKIAAFEEQDRQKRSWM